MFSLRSSNPIHLFSKVCLRVAASCLLMASGPGCDEASEEKMAGDAPGVVVRSPEEAPVAKGVNSISDSFCERLCALSVELKCPQPTGVCMRVCEEMNSGAECSAEMERVRACMSGTDPSGWSCGEDGFLALRSGHCEAEQGAVVACLAASIQP